jgi:hypothetical protein
VRHVHLLVSLAKISLNFLAKGNVTTGFWLFYLDV